MGSVPTLVSRAERPLAQAKAHRLYVLVDRGAAPSRLHRRVCLQVAAIAPRLSVDRLAVLARHTLWSYQLDDRLDAPGADQAALAALRDQLAAVTAGADPSPPDPGRPDPGPADPGPADPGPAGRGAVDPLVYGLRWLLGELVRRQVPAPVRDRFATALREAVAADVEHVLLARAVAAGTAAPPTAEEYLAVAAGTVNYLSFTYLLLGLGGGPLTADQLAHIVPALWHGAYAVRLGNDLRGAAGDRAGPGLNVLKLRYADGSPVTAGDARAELDRRVRAHHDLLADLASRRVIAERPARLLTRCLRQSIRLYRHTDLR